VNEKLETEDEKYAILATSALTEAGRRVLKHGDTFAVFDHHGNIHPVGLGEQGLYHDGTRYLSRMHLRLEEDRLLLLSSTVRENNLLLAVDLTNPDLYRGGEVVVPHGTLHVFRSIFLWHDTCYEQLQISNYGPRAVDIRLVLDVAADFVDVFEVRGTRRARRGALAAPHLEGELLVLGYTGLDGVVRTTRVAFSPQPDVSHVGEVGFSVHLEAKQSKDIYLTISCETQSDPPRVLPSFENAHAEANAALRTAEQRKCSIYTANEQLNDWLNRSQADLQMMTTDTPYGPYPYAGVPWFSTPFGRDGIIAALEALWVDPELAAGVLRCLAAHQATDLDPQNDAEPGKILHEMRRGEMAALREIPFGHYYGSIDSTPLFLMLAGRYWECTADLATIRELWPNIERALEWIDRWGDMDGDGFVEYGRHSKDGLVQQGWKDSNDSVFHADGSAAEGPIALCEVQGYVYSAKHRTAGLAKLLGRAELAERLEREAEDLRLRFDRAFWCEELSTYALALDARKRPCRVRSSNAGQCLFTGIALPERAPRIADQLLDDAMFSGWGIRTLASSEQRYNPMSYHNGSVWPHDNALIAAGLGRYGLQQHAARILGALFDASLFMDLHRLPELFCGFVRRPGEGPTLYPVACAPQAWAAAVPFLLLQASLGMRIEAAERRVRFDHPTLPPFLEDVEINHLRVADAYVDLRLQRYPDDVGINIAGRSGQVSVMVVK
jgi:glycogen debranching enzyme